MTLKRKKARDAVTGGNQAIDMAYNNMAGALKGIPVMGSLTPLGDAATARNCNLGAMVLFFNPSASPVYVTFGSTSGVAAPAAGAGFPVPAGQFVVYPATGNYLISSALCYSYVMEDESYLSDSDI